LWLELVLSDLFKIQENKKPAHSLVESSGIRNVFRRLPMKMTTGNRQIGGVTIVDISGRIELGEESAALRDLVRDLLSKGHKQILLNLGDVHHIDSAGLGALVGASTSVRKQGGELKLLNLTNKVGDVMEITKLYTVFDIMNDEAAAVKSFGQSTSATA
jgi:anti-sigma B factor antagonist